MHGGLTPVLTGTTLSAESLESAVQQYMDDPSIFDLRRDLATLRALRDATIKEYELSDPLTKERDMAVIRLSGIISNIVRSSERFFELMSRQNFALTVAQARQIRETMKTILREEANRRAAIIAPVSETIPLEIMDWRDRIAERLTTELNIESEEGKYVEKAGI